MSEQFGFGGEPNEEVETELKAMMQKPFDFDQAIAKQSAYVALLQKQLEMYLAGTIIFAEPSGVLCSFSKAIADATQAWEALVRLRSTHKITQQLTFSTTDSAGTYSTSGDEE